MQLEAHFLENAVFQKPLGWRSAKKEWVLDRGMGRIGLFNCRWDGTLWFRSRSTSRAWAWPWVVMVELAEAAIGDATMAATGGGRWRFDPMEYLLADDIASTTIYFVNMSGVIMFNEISGRLDDYKRRWINKLPTCSVRTGSWQCCSIWTRLQILDSTPYGKQGDDLLINFTISCLWRASWRSELLKPYKWLLKHP